MSESHNGQVKPTISAILLVHNEEKKILNCLESLKFVNEIVAVFDKSTDDSEKIFDNFCNDHKRIKFIKHNGSWNIEGERRNIALNLASSDWLLEIDCDEVISSKLAQEILLQINKKHQEIIKLNLDNTDQEANKIKLSQTITHFYLTINNYIGSRHIKYGWLRTMAVASRNSISYNKTKIYNQDSEIHPTYNIIGNNITLNNPLFHYMDDNICDFITRFNRYTNWRANDLILKEKIKVDKNNNSCCKKIFVLIKEIYGFKFRFIKSFFIKKGYKEGVIGLVIAIFAGIYPLISRAKALEKINQ